MTEQDELQMFRDEVVADMFREMTKDMMREAGVLVAAHPLVLGPSGQTLGSALNEAVRGAIDPKKLIAELTWVDVDPMTYMDLRNGDDAEQLVREAKRRQCSTPACNAYAAPMEMYCGNCDAGGEHLIDQGV